MKKLVVTGGAILVLAAVGLGIALTRGEDTNAPPPKIETVRRGNFTIRINASGNLESLLSVEVKSNVEGEIERLFVKDGDHVEKDQVLLQINDEQIREEMRQAEANVAAAQAQYEQALRSLAIREKQLDSELQQLIDNVHQAEANLNVVKAQSLQQISQAEANLQNTREALAQDKLILSQAKIALRQAELTLSETEGSEKAALVDLNNAKSELARTRKLFDKQYVSKKALEDAQATHANAESRYETAQKRVAGQEAAVESQQQTITTRQHAVQMRETTLKFEEQNLDILKQTRKAQEDQAETQLRTAQTRLDESRGSIEDEKDVSRFSIKSAEANLLRNQSTLKNQQERLAWTTILAPMPGTVINLNIEEGEIVTSGRSAFSQGPPVMNIVDLSQMVVKTYINEVDMEKLKLDQRAEVSVSAYPNRPFRGEVREISPSGAPRDNIVYFEVMIAVLGSPQELRPGMTADVDIVVVENKNVLLLPIEAVNEERALLAQVSAPMNALSLLNPGVPVRVALSTGKNLMGKVSRRLPAEARGNVEISVANAGRAARPGLTSVTLTVGEKELAGVSAMLSFGKRYHVLRIQGEKKVEAVSGPPKTERVEIQVGQQNETDMEILGGVQARDRVLVQDAAPAGPGQWRGRR